MNEDKKNIWLMIMSEKKKKTIKELIFTNLWYIKSQINFFLERKKKKLGIINIFLV
jgi:hypothetical protein